MLKRLATTSRAEAFISVVLTRSSYRKLTHRVLRPSKLHVAALSGTLMEPTPPTEQHPEGQAALNLAGFDIEGISIAGQQTCIILPGLNLVFDTGRCPQRSIYQRNVLLSHAHLDHIGGLPHHISTRQMVGLPPTRVLLPGVIAEGTRKILDAFGALDGCDYACDITPCQAGDAIQLNKSLQVQPFTTYHRIPSQGYVIVSQKEKLKPHLIGQPGSVIRDRKLAGEAVTDTHVVAEVAFTGDTTGEWITQPGAELALRAKLLIMEVTFLDDSVSLEKAHSRGHTHINEIVAHAEKFQNEAILLIHLSARYSRSAALRLLDEKLPPSLKSRCTPLLEGFK